MHLSLRTKRFALCSRYSPGTGNHQVLVWAAGPHDPWLLHVWLLSRTRIACHSLLGVEDHDVRAGLVPFPVGRWRRIRIYIAGRRFPLEHVTEANLARWRRFFLVHEGERPRQPVLVGAHGVV